MGISEDIAKAALDINAIKLRPDDPFTWASGYRMPIYNDNRRLLNSYEHRQLVTEGFKELIEKNNIDFDMVVGTSTSGIAPAASVAREYEVPLVIFHKNEPYMFAPFNMDTGLGMLRYSEDTSGRINAIASTAPWAIPGGVSIANKTKLPFMYVRQKVKGHGLKQQIEGIPAEGQEVLLFDLYDGESYIENAKQALLNLGVKTIATGSKDISKILKPAAIKGRKALIIEDLISFGGSSAGEVTLARNNGAYAEWCISIFSYGLDESAEIFRKMNPKCNIDSAFFYDDLLKTAVKENYINNAQQEILGEWRPDPTNWGINHGFPKEEK
ncbi:MAG: hypothetical protein ABH828_00335 [archaeon]